MRKRHGSILVLVLFVLVVVSMIAASVAYRAGLATRAARDRAVMARLQASAESAVAVAMIRLGENENDFDHPSEPWCTHPALWSAGWLPEWNPRPGERLPEILADYDVIDEEGKQDVAFASSETFTKLGMSREQVASLFDWMDEDDSAMPLGAEGSWYLSLPTPYRCKNAPLEMLDELLLIREFSQTDYWGVRVLPGNLKRQILHTPLADTTGASKSLGWVNVLTCGGDGKINLNTAPLPVLQSLPLAPGAADQIARYRDVDSGAGGKLEEHVFKSEKDIDQLQGLTSEDRAVLKGVAVFQSSRFRIFARAEHVPTGLEYHLQVLVLMKEKKPKIMQWKVAP